MAHQKTALSTTTTASPVSVLYLWWAAAMLVLCLFFVCGGLQLLHSHNTALHLSLPRVGFTSLYPPRWTLSGVVCRRVVAIVFSQQFIFGRLCLCFVLLSIRRSDCEHRRKPSGRANQLFIAQRPETKNKIGRSVVTILI